MAQAQLLQAAAAAAAMEGLEDEQEEEQLDQEATQAAKYLVNELRQVESSKPVSVVVNGQPIKRQRNRPVQRPSARTRTMMTTTMTKKAKMQAKSTRALPCKSPKRAAPKRIAPKLAPMASVKTQNETIAAADVARPSTSDFDNLPQTGALNTLDLTLPIPPFPSALAAAPAPPPPPHALTQIPDQNATLNAHARALLFFGLYFDMYLAPAIESQALCDPSHYVAPADTAALVLGPSSVSRTHSALFKFQILQSFATLLLSHSHTLSLDSLFQHFLACCISHGVSFA